MLQKRKLQNGVALVAIIIVIAVVAIAAGAYFFTKGGGTSLFGPKISEKEFEFVDDPLVRKHLATQANVSAYRTKGSTSGFNRTTTTEVQYSGNDLKYRTIEYESSKEISHQISIGDTVYIKDYSDNKWWKQTIKPEETSEEDKPVDVKEEYKQLEVKKPVYKKLGEEACGNLTCHKYQESISGAIRVFWFDKSKFLLRKDEVTFGGIKGTNEYEYDGIAINAPSPTKEVPEGRSIYEYIGGGGGASTPARVSPKDMESIPTLPPEFNYSVPSEE